MRLCPECGVVLLEDIRFCLQCGSSLPTADPVMPSAVEVAPESYAGSPVVAAPPSPLPDIAPAGREPETPPEPPPEPPPALGPPPLPVPPGPVQSEVSPADDAPRDEDFVIPRPIYSPNSTLTLRISPSPMIAPREGVPLERPRSKPGRDMVELDEEVLSKSFQKPTGTGGSVLCRFCKGPLDLEGDFCEQCGAPVADAAPPGTVKRKNPTASPAEASALSAGKPPARSPAEPDAALAQPAPEMPIDPAQEDSAPPSPEFPPGFVGRLRNIFKKD